MAPGFFFFLTGLGEVSEGECPLEEWVGLDTFLFCGAAGRSANPGGSGTASRKTPMGDGLVLFTALNTLQSLNKIKTQLP